MEFKTIETNPLKDLVKNAYQARKRSRLNELCQNRGGRKCRENIIIGGRWQGGRGRKKGGMLTTLVNATVERHNYK